MKKLFVLLLAVLMTLTLTACSGQKEEPIVEQESFDICLFFTGTFGGHSNHDNIYNYLKGEFLTENPNCTFSYMECAGDTSVYESKLNEVCAEEKYEIILLGNYAMAEYVAAAAEKFPDQKFLFYDAAIDYTTGKFDNVTSIQLAQNELAFKAGALAALVTESDAELANADKVVGYVGPGENTATWDFLVGFIDGVNYVDPSIDVKYNYLGNWSDTALAKEFTGLFAQQGADVVYAVCGGAGSGVMEGALENNIYAIGCDYDVQADLAAGGNASADYVLTSTMKDFPHIIGNAIKSMAAGTYDKWATHTWVDASYPEADYLLLLDTTNYEKLPQSVKDAYNAVVADLEAGKIEVRTAIGASEDDLKAIFADAAAK